MKKNVTLSIDSDLLERSRRYAEDRGMSLNKLIGSLLQVTVRGNADESWASSLFEKMDRISVRRPGRTWKREDIYDV